MGRGLGGVLGLLLLCSACAGDTSGGAQPPPPPLTGQPQVPTEQATPDGGTAVGFVRQYGADGGFVEPRELGSDRDGGLFLLAMGSAPDLGGGPLAKPTGFALARYGADGAHVWSRSFPLAEDFSGPTATALAVSPAGDLFVGGSYWGSPDLGGGPLPAIDQGQAMFLARFAADGRPVWSRAFVAHVRLGAERRTAFMSVGDLALDAAGNLFVTGSFQGAVDLGAVTLGRERVETEGHFFLARLSPDGTALWATAFEEAIAGADLSFGTTLATDPTSGDVVVSGASSPGEEVSGSAFVARFGAGGQRQWLRRFEGELPEGNIGQRVHSLAVGPDGTVYFAGEFSRRLRFAGEVLQSRPPHFFDSGARPDLLLGAFSAAGAPQWVRELPALGEGTAAQVLVEADGGLLVRGELFSVADLGTGPLTPGPFVARYSARGAALAASTLDPRLQVTAQALQPGGHLVLAGQPSTAAVVDGRALVPMGHQDLVLLQLELSRLPERPPALPADSLGSAGTPGFVRTFSVAGQQFFGSMHVRTLAGTADGGFVALGRSDHGTFGGPSLAGSSGLVLARYDAHGTHQWTRAFLRSRRDEGPVGLALAVAPDGDLLVAGTYSGAPDLGGGALPRARVDGALFLARFSPAGRHVWSRGFDPRRAGEGLAAFSVGGLAVGPEGDAVVTGGLRGAVDLGSGPLGSATEADTDRLFVARFDAAGSTRWSTSLAQATAGAAVSSGTAVAVDAAGEVLVAGSLRPSQESAEGSAFVARLEAGGTARWVHRLESTHLAAVYSLAVDGAGTAFLGGELQGELRFAGQTVRSKASDTLPELLLGALDASGAERWVRELPEAGEGRVEQLALDDAGRLRVRGQLLSPADLGQGPLLPGPFVASYAPDGTPLGARSFDPHLTFSGLALQPGGGLVLGGTFDAEVELAGQRLVPQAPGDLLYLQLLP